MYLTIAISSGVLALGLLLLAFISTVRSRKNSDPLVEHLRHRRISLKESQRKSGRYRIRFQFYSRVPGMRRFVSRIYLGYGMIGERDRNLLIKKTVSITEKIILMNGLLLFLFYYMTKNLGYTFIFGSFLLVLSDSYIAFYMANSHHRLLKQFKKYMTYVRQMYYEYGVIDDAVYEANQQMQAEEREMLIQGEKIHDVLTSKDIELTMSQYFESAPNNYLKMFLSFAHMTLEYGDQKLDGRSVFLTNLDYLCKNIELELVKRQKLNFALKSMNIIVLLPLVFISLVKSWAVNNFAPLNMFYSSSLGKYTEIGTIIVILVSMIIIHQLQNIDQQMVNEKPIEKWIFKIKVPIEQKKKLKWFYGLLFFIVALFVVMLVNVSNRNQLAKLVYYESGFLSGSYNGDEINALTKESKIDYGFIKSSHERVSNDEIEYYLEANNYEVTEGRVTRILEKVKRYHQIELSWWHFLMAIVFGTLGYQVPEMLSHIKRRVKEMDVQDEISNFRSIIMMLIFQPRMSVMEVVEWLERYSVFYKEELHKCLIHMSEGEGEALMSLKVSVFHEDMKKIAHQLLKVSEGLKFQDAFDELIAEKNTFFEQRKWNNEKLIHRKIALGQTVGFMPMYTLIILYLIVPMVVSSARELEQFLQYTM